MHFKLTFFLWISTILRPIQSNIFQPSIGADCISIFQIIKATQILCDNKNNATLWQQCIDCHFPISEKFLRESGEAQCPITKAVENPLDTSFSIQEVFFNICGLVQADVLEIAEGLACVILGKRNVMNHFLTIERVKQTWGAEVPCSVGKCILGMGLNL